MNRTTDAGHPAKDDKTMTKFIIAIAVAATALLTGCRIETPQDQRQVSAARDIQIEMSRSVDEAERAADKAKQSEADLVDFLIPKRFSVTRVEVVRDGLAYGGKRGVYVVVDKKTGKEFVGVSGVGIAETGSSMTGKIVTDHER